MKKLVVWVLLLFCANLNTRAGCSDIHTVINGVTYYFPSSPTITNLGNDTLTYGFQSSGGSFVETISLYHNGVLIYQAKNPNQAMQMKPFKFIGYQGNYHAIYYVGCLHRYQDFYFTLLGPPTAINELTQAQGIIVFPNPSSIAIKIQSPENIQSVALYSLEGLKLYESYCDEKCIELLITPYPPGIYFLEVAVLGRSPVIRKIIRQ